MPGPVVKKQPRGVALVSNPASTLYAPLTTDHLALGMLQPTVTSGLRSRQNYPWQLTLTPLVNAIAAGCAAIIKPAELSPASSALMARLIPLYLDPSAYAVVLGGPEISGHLLKKQWGHSGLSTLARLALSAALMGQSCIRARTASARSWPELRPIRSRLRRWRCAYTIDECLV